MKQHFTIINGEFLDKETASILVTDLSVQRGYGIFDFFKTINKRPIFLEDHLDRFFYSVAEMNLKSDLKRDQLKKMVLQLIDKNDIPNSGIRITLTGGDSEDGYSIAKPNLIITQAPFENNPDDFKTGIRLMTHEHQRQLPHVKTIDYLYAIYLQRLIREKKADDVLYHNQSEITECPRANFFVITHNNEVITPAKNILRGVIRKKILNFSQLVNIREGLITIKDLQNAKEAFITSSTKNVLPVVKIDNNVIGDGKPGEITTKISRKLMELISH
ncbi:MAG: aminotransferase class IV [Ginsengibacter sp.]